MRRQSFVFFNTIYGRRQPMRGVLAGATGVLLVLVMAGAAAWGQKEAEQKNMKLIGSNDLQARSGY